MYKRIDLLDATRGFCVIYMVFYHFMYNLVYMVGVNSSFLYNPIMNILQFVVASLFITLCGISCNFSKSNLKRGSKLFLIAIIITIATYCFSPSFYVVFGIIHFLAFATLSYGLFQKFFEKIRLNFSFPLILLALFAWFYLNILPLRFDISGLSFLGITNTNFRSSDYFPVFPWIFLFYIGIYLGRKIKENQFPAWFYSYKNSFLANIGKKSLAIYVLHQPILIALTYAIIFIKE